MPQPVKVADALTEAARVAAEDNNRSMGAQIEHWALLGRAVAQALTLDDAIALKRSEGHLNPATRVRLAEALGNALDPLRSSAARTAIGLRDAIRYETDPSLPGFLIQRLPDDSRRVGKLVDREFIAIPSVTESAAT